MQKFPIMGVIQLKTCCGVFSLRTGSLIILWINLIIGLIFALTPTVSNLSSSSGRSIDGSPSSQYIAVELGKKVTTTPATETDWDAWSNEFSLNSKAVQVFRMWSPITGWVIITTTISALFGVYKAKPIFILPFILSSIFIAFLLAVVEIAVTSRQFIFCTIAYLLLHSEIFIYFILVLYSHFRTIAGYDHDV